jgi:hypothetical protein
MRYISLGYSCMFPTEYLPSFTIPRIVGFDLVKKSVKVMEVYKSQSVFNVKLILMISFSLGTLDLTW